MLKNYKTYIPIIVMFICLASCSKPDVSDRGEHVFKDAGIVSADLEAASVKVSPGLIEIAEEWPASDFYSELGPTNHAFTERYEVVKKIHLRPTPVFSKERQTNIFQDFKNKVFAMRGRKVLLISPVVFDNIIIIADHQGIISAIDINTYKPIWEYAMVKILKKQIKSLSQVSISYGNDKLFITTNNGYIVTLNAVDGKFLWVKKLSGIFRAPFKYAIGKLYGISSMGEFIILNANNGDEIMNHKTMDIRQVTKRQASVLLGNTVAIASFPNGDIIGFDLETAGIKWLYDLSQASSTSMFSFHDIDFIPAFVNGYIIAGAINGSTYLIRESDGSIVWTKEITIGSQVAIAGNFAFFLDSTNHLIAMQWQTGNIKWTQKLQEFKVEEVPMHLNGGERWRYTKISFKGPIIANSKILLFSNLGELKVIDPNNGKEINSFLIPYYMQDPIIVNKMIYGISNEEGRLIVIR